MPGNRKKSPFTMTFLKLFQVTSLGYDKHISRTVESPPKKQHEDSKPKNKHQNKSKQIK
jgi:hypothetical protein